MNRFNLKIVILLLLVALGVYFFIHYDLYTFFINKKKAISFINSFGSFSVLVFISFQILQVIAAPIPGEVTGFIGGYLYGSVLGTIYSTIGLTIGSWLAFVLARFYGLPFMEKAVKPSVLRKYDSFLEHQGAFVSFMLFLIPGFPKDYLCYVMGLSHMDMRAFLIIATIGRLFGTILLSVSGSYFRNKQIEALLIALTVGGCFLLLGYSFREKLLEMLKRR